MSCEYTYGSAGAATSTSSTTWEHGGITMGIARGAMKTSGRHGYLYIGGKALATKPTLAPGNSSLMMRKGDVLVQIDLREAGVSGRCREENGSDNSGATCEVRCFAVEDVACYVSVLGAAGET